MSSHSKDPDVGLDNLDGMIRWALHEAVADAEPSPDLWERIENQVRSVERRRRDRPLRRLWLSWLIGAGASYPVPADPRLAWQRHLHAFDMRASLSMVRILESSMPVLRVVA
jgi:hypothetical protein